ncbi:MAG: transcription antitermination factor NusB [Gemmatimonadota bacterium]|nr:transcription antitermination factor NusB [Gemmatimonadota bacterium]
MRIESRARSRALQALYAWDMREGTALDRISQQVWDDLAVSREEQEFAGFLIRILIARGAEIDGSLAAVTTNWRLSRLGAIERSVLRLAIAELLQGTTPPRVVIKESVRLAERYGSERSAKFVNGVLDAYARQQGML